MLILYFYINFRRLLINIGLWSIEPPLERGRNLFRLVFIFSEIIQVHSLIVQ